MTEPSQAGLTPPAAAAAPTSFQERFDALLPVAYRVAFRIIGDREDASDVAAETLAKAWVRWPKVEAYAEAWVARVSANAALSHVSRRRRRPALPVSAADTGDDGIDRNDLVRALRRLPERQRRVVVLRYLADMSEVDVARALGCSLGTVKQHAHRGVQALRGDAALRSSTPARATDRPTPQEDLR